MCYTFATKQWGRDQAMKRCAVCALMMLVVALMGWAVAETTPEKEGKLLSFGYSFGSYRGSEWNYLIQID